MNAVDWAFISSLVTISASYAAFSVGRVRGRSEARACTICHDAQHPRHDEHATWRCIDRDGCNYRQQRRERINRAARAAEARAAVEGIAAAAPNQYIGRALMREGTPDTVPVVIPGDQAIRVGEPQDEPADRYERSSGTDGFLNDL